MEKDFNSKDMWNKASGAALALGAIPIVAAFASMLLGQLTGSSVLINVIRGFIAFIIWAAKFAGCIYLMNFFMERVRKSFSGVTKSDLFKFGSAIALLSALIVAAYQLIDVVYIEPEKVNMVKEMFNSPMYAKLDANSIEALNSMAAYFPQITFFSNFIYCTIYGVVLSSILAGRLVSKEL